LLAGCAGYSYTINDREVFSPAPLFRGYEIADAALAACVQQAIEDQRVTRPEALQDLKCSQAGIASLAGIEVFTGLRRLGLDGNRLFSVAPLEALKDLSLLQLRDNRLRGFERALCGNPGREVALSGNSDFACADLERLRACGVSIVDAPAHCGG
jgi:hypothetical protein